MNDAMKSSMKSDVQPCWLAEGRCEVVVQEQVQRRPFRFAVDRDILLVVDAHDGVSDVSQLAGDPAHAPALIDRALRGQGLMDGDCAVVVHATARRPADYDALFTAYPSEWWASALKGGVPMAYSLRRAPPASGDASPPATAGVSLERSVSSLWSDLHCGDLIAAAPRAHANAALAADMMRYAADEKEVLAGINHDAAVAAAVFAVLDAVIQTARVPYKAMMAAMSCTNMSSQLIDIGAGSGDGGQISALAQTTLSCLTSAVTIATHIANVASNWVGVGVAIDKLARLDDAALAHRQAHADAVRALVVDVNAHAQESVYRGLYLR